jgi:hydroxypyruvate isomerase
MLNRRELLTHSLAAAAAASALGKNAVAAGAALGSQEKPPAPAKLKGRLKQSACRWCYGSIPLEELCRAAAEMGLRSVELLREKEWGIPAKFGITCAMADGIGTIGDGWNRVESHEKLVKQAERLIPLVAEAKLPNLITFSGNRAGQADDEGARNCAAGLKKIAPLAEKHGVTICLELLNSKVDHPDYQCDRSAWGISVVKGVGSERVKLLYDIYHMQIMEGDVIRTIRDNLKYIGHFHTGGVPGRREIDDSQELNYRAVCKAILEAGYQGYVGQEFVPSGDPLASLRRCAEICDV